MCGRYSLHHSWAEVHAYYDLFRTEDQARNVPARYNIAPTQDVLLVAEPGGERRLLEGRWWLVPFWAKELTSKWPMFNARSEDAEKKPAFRDAYKSKRCLLPASGYYEWTKAEDGGKDPHHIHLPDHEHFAFAGLWATNDQVADETVTSCTILTAAAAPEIEHLHKRMPIILPQESFDEWLSADTDVPAAKALLANNRGHELVSYPVSREVNSSRAQGDQLIEAA